MASVFPPILFKSTDSGAPTVSGTAGDLLKILSSCLCINNMFTAVSGAAFVDNTAEARSQGGVAFALFQGPTVNNDEAYIGMSAKFGRAKFIFGTAGVQATAVTLAFEYWNGSAWTALSGVTDGTSGLTANGNMTWTIPANWTANAVNGVTQFWMRIRFTAGTWTTNPLVATLSVTGWSIAFGPTGNVADYQMGGGNQFYLDVNDNAPGAGLGREARVRGFEAMTALATGTGAFPTVAQQANGLFVRKSATADATTRMWYVLADDRTAYIFIATGDGALGRYFGFMFGDMFSLVPNDSFRTILIARSTENSASAGTGTGAVESLLNKQANISGVIGNTPATVLNGHYQARAYTGLGTSVQTGKSGDDFKSLSTDIGGSGQIPLPNPPDGGFYIGPIWVNGENATAVFRGRMRGMWEFYHPITTVADGDTFSGSGVLTGKTFIIIKFTADAGAVYIMETSDTWETN